MEMLEEPRSNLLFYVNGQEVRIDVGCGGKNEQLREMSRASHMMVFLYYIVQVCVRSPDPEITLLYYLRNNCILQNSSCIVV